MITPTLRRAGFQTLPRIQPLSLILLPLLLFTLFPALAQDDSTVLYPGTYQAEDARVARPDDAQLVDADGAEFGNVVAGHQFQFNAYGTDIFIRWFGVASIDVTVGEQSYRLFDEAAFANFDNLPGKVYNLGRAWQEATVHLSSTAELHNITLDGAENVLQIDSITVVDRTFQNVAPLAAGVLIGVVMLVYVVVSSLRARWAK